MSHNLNGRYARSDLLRVLRSLEKQAAQRMGTGGTKYPAYFVGKDENTIVLPPAADTDTPMDETILELFQETMPRYLTAEELEGKRIVFALAEKHGFYGLCSRDHWVTIHYDTVTRTGTLIDSRPWWSGMFYPTWEPRDGLKEALESIGLTLEDWNIVYQAVQHNDIHCGAWTAANILSFAEGTTLEAQANIFKDYDEQRIVERNRKLVELREGNLKDPKIELDDPGDDHEEENTPGFKL